MKNSKAMTVLNSLYKYQFLNSQYSFMLTTQFSIQNLLFKQLTPYQKFWNVYCVIWWNVNIYHWEMWNITQPGQGQLWRVFRFFGIRRFKDYAVFAYVCRDLFSDLLKCFVVWTFEVKKYYFFFVLEVNPTTIVKFMNEIYSNF